MAPYWGTKDAVLVRMLLADMHRHHHDDARAEAEHVAAADMFFSWNESAKGLVQLAEAFTYANHPSSWRQHTYTGSLPNAPANCATD